MRTHPFIRLLAVAGLAALPLLVACSSADAPPAPVSPSPSPSQSPSQSPSPSQSQSQSPSQSPSQIPSQIPSPAGLVPVWPFTTPAQVEGWQAAYRAGGERPWHLDVEHTALAFTRDHLRYVEVDRVTTRTVDGSDARIGVGWSNENGGLHTVAVLHLVRFGSGQDSPWVVVGSDDTWLTLTAPRYGATVTSPLTVGGRITGVDESLRVVVLGPASNTPLAVVGGLPAGGERTPWTTTVRFTAPRGTVLTVAVSTGGHLRDVERFAITAVRAA